MISIEKMRELLGNEGKGLSDEELERLRDDQYQLAELAFGQWCRDKGIK